MDSTHLHLALSHFPIIGTIIGIAILVYGLISKSLEAQKVALAIFIVMSILTVPVFLSGEGAEDTIENRIGVPEQFIENHEELAEIAIWFMGVLGILSLISFFAIFKKLSFAKAITLFTLIVSLVTFVFFVQLGNLGGQIRHSEIRNGSNNEQLNINNAKIKHDDD